jgi:hypothetical protein
MEPRTKCGCSDSLAVICGVFGGGAVVLLLAEDRCLDAGGKLSDFAWTCQTAPGTTSSLWALATPGIITTATIVGFLIYLALRVLGRRWIFRHSKQHG